MHCVSRLVKTFHRFNVVSPSISVGSFSKTYCFQTASTPVLQRNSLRYSYCSSATAKESSNEENRLNDDHTDKSKKTKLLTVLVGSAVAFLGSSYILYNKMKKAKAEAVEDSKVDVKVEEISEDEEESGKKKKKHGFRERRIVEYENRIRQYSTPDKVFRYFASIKDDSEVFMTPADFVRALTPGKIQPEGLGLDAHERFDQEKHKYVPSNQVNQIGGKSVFAQMGEYGLISFSDYIFLLTVLSIPPRMFEMAFQMFDLNGDGNVDPSEFEKIQSVLFSMTSTGMRHRDHSTTGSVLSSHVNSGLKEYMFGKTLEKKLTTRRFIEFQRQLQKEVMLLEFQSYEPEDGKISEVEFADMLLTYSSFHEKKKQKILKRVRKAFKDNSQGVTFKDYLDFFCFLRNITEAEIALSFHNAAGKSIDPVTFKRVASTVSDVSLQDHVIKVVYKMFDENDDGELSHKEFVLVMKNQLVRGLENPKDTGFAKLLSALSHCAKHCVHQVLMGEKK